MAVPNMRFESDRQGLLKWAAGKGEEGMKEYRAKNNRRSLDGIPIPTEA